MCNTKHLFPLCHTNPGKLHPISSTPQTSQGCAGSSLPLSSALEGTAPRSMELQRVSWRDKTSAKQHFNSQRKSSDPWLGLGGRSITRKQTAPKTKAATGIRMEYFSGFGRRWLRQRVSSCPSSLDSCVIPAGISSLPRRKQNNFRDRTSAGGSSTADSASPTLPSTQDFKPFTSKGNWRNRLTSSIPGCWQIPNTDFVTHRLCLQWNDLGIEGLSNMGPQPNTSRSTKYLMIPDSWNQSPGAKILFNFFSPRIKQNCTAQTLLSTNH